MKKKKHQWHCAHCGNPCEIYKKGKGHRILDCPQCGIIAKNPTMAGKLIKGIARSVPVVGGVAGEIIEGIQEKKERKEPRAPQRDKAYYSYKEKLLEEALRG